MAPAVVSRSPAKRPGTEGLAESANAGVPVALIDERHRALRDAMRTLRREIESRTEDVGAKFPDVARAIQAGDGPERAIRGQAKPEEVEALLEEGIGVLPMPYAPDDFN